MIQNSLRHSLKPSLLFSYKNLLFGLFFLICHQSIAQVKVEGYAYEDNNRGYLNLVKIKLSDSEGRTITEDVFSDLDGKFNLGQLPLNTDFQLFAEKEYYEPTQIKFSTKDKSNGEKLFLKVEMSRKPGYNFDITLTGPKSSEDFTAESLKGARVEVYNNTSEKEVLNIRDLDSPSFRLFMEKGNHYTILIRKKGFFNKRIEAYVNVRGCILCIDGINNVQPGVTDNLTQGFNKGMLLANIEMQPLRLNQTMRIENIYYDYDQSFIRKDAAKELEKVVTLLKTNPAISVELGSHTDSRGNNEYNLKLSAARAKAAVDYIVSKGIDSVRIKSKGYGESVLTNRCKDGVVCSEEEHQNNRRTELKIVGIGVDPLDDKTLVDILRAEKFDRDLEKLQNQQQIVVEDGENAQVKMEENERIQKLKDQSKQQLKEQILEMTESEVSQKWNFDKFPLDSVFRIKSYKLDGNDTYSEVKIYDFPKAYSGYTIEFQVNNNYIESDNAIFSRYDEVIVTKRSDNKYHYYVGNFLKPGNAEVILKEVVKPMFPGARILYFKNGFPNTIENVAPKPKPIPAKVPVKKKGKN